MDLSDVVIRWSPAGRTELLTPAGVLVVLALTAVAVGWAPAWRVLRLAVTLVHELGHAGAGVAVGRRFTGFVLRRDMSGHAVTVGRPKGPGMVATTWAGYPVPAVVGRQTSGSTGPGTLSNPKYFAGSPPCSQSLSVKFG